MNTVLNALNQALHRAMQADARVHLLGEDILDPYGGAFKVTKGLSTAFPKRVHSSPISEAGIVGAGIGMALRGLRPVIEIMFGDFSTLIADQLINHAAKFPQMYNDRVSVPLVVRTPMGGRRGYGATHSQTLEKLFMGIPGLRVVAPASVSDPGHTLETAILHDDWPVFFVENKLQYLAKTNLSIDFEQTTHEGLYPTHALRIAGAPAPNITITAYGYMADLALQAARTLAYEHEIFAEIIVPTQLSPMMMPPLTGSLAQTRCLLTLEEGTYSLGWGAEILARATESPDIPAFAGKRLAAHESIIPAAGPLEEAVFPHAADIVAAARSLL